MTGNAYISPSKNKIYTACTMIAATLISGTVLAVASHSHLLSVCVSGLLYLGTASVGIVAASKKLAREISDNQAT